MAEPPKDNLLHMSWSDSMWVPHLNSTNVMDYFSERSNPFYSRECNNEFIKMQQNTRMDQLQHMQGIEYQLLHAQEPILYIVRKQHRYSPTQTTPLNNYHVIAGEVYQTPDLSAIINSRLLSAVSQLNGAFTEHQSFSQYHPSRGYWWHFRNKQHELEEAKRKEKEKKSGSTAREEPASLFQRRRVDMLLADLQKNFPYKMPSMHQPQQTQNSNATGGIDGSGVVGENNASSGEQKSSLNQQQSASTPNADHAKSTGDDMKVEIKQEAGVKVEVKQEPGVPVVTGSTAQRNATKPPPEKRQRTGP
ncbi:unnamed protein product [Meganyctiphanes norvegica]|uniref:Mediator of RNA polymerase II transcription subunit 6 n=1 Tax=Meganyctiphanes norvegica TaxID=48144 RepID=A0AAV2PI30_MEGNR